MQVYPYSEAISVVRVAAVSSQGKSPGIRRPQAGTKDFRVSGRVLSEAVTPVSGHSTATGRDNGLLDRPPSPSRIQDSLRRRAAGTVVERSTTATRTRGSVQQPVVSARGRRMPVPPKISDLWRNRRSPLAAPTWVAWSDQSVRASRPPGARGPRQSAPPAGGRRRPGTPRAPRR